MSNFRQITAKPNLYRVVMCVCLCVCTACEYGKSKSITLQFQYTKLKTCKSVLELICEMDSRQPFSSSKPNMYHIQFSSPISRSLHFFLIFLIFGGRMLKNKPNYMIQFNLLNWFSFSFYLHTFLILQFFFSFSSHVSVYDNKVYELMSLKSLILFLIK